MHRQPENQIGCVHLDCRIPFCSPAGLSETLEPLVKLLASTTLPRTAARPRPDLVPDLIYRLSGVTPQSACVTASAAGYNRRMLDRALFRCNFCLFAFYFFEWGKECLW